MGPTLWLAAAVLAPQSAAPDDETFFEERVRPVLVEHCYRCHSNEADRVRGRLRVDTRDDLLRGGSSGPAIVPGDADHSLLIQAVRGDDPDLTMPPDAPLSAGEVADLAAWVDAGAFDPRTPEVAAPPLPEAYDFESGREHWAFRPLGDPAPPPVADEGWARNALDRFVLARLERAGLRPAPEADPATWLRRLHVDLTGLFPTEEELDRFLADDASGVPGAHERAIDALLDSPHYGERWGRRWLDVARYADSNGVDENLALGEAWRYRDWVVRALNEDLPYDRFVRMQVAGDLLPDRAPDDFDPLIATGFLVLGPKMLAEQDKDKLVMDIVDEQIDVTSQAFLGLTVGCARCHDHKFDPVPTRDYYALAGVFKSTSTMVNLDHVSQWRERPLATPAEVAALEAYQARLKEAGEAVARITERAAASLQPAWRQDTAAYLLAATGVLDRTLALEAEEASRTNLVVDDSQYGDARTTVARTGGGDAAQWIEWDVTVSAPGSWSLAVRAAADEARPLRLVLDGASVRESVVDADTGSWRPEGQAWFDLGDLELRAGRNVVRLEREGPFPHVDRVVLAPSGTCERAAARFAKLEPGIVRAWAAHLAQARRRGDPLLAAWLDLAALPEAEFAERAPARIGALRSRLEAGELDPLAGAFLDGLPPRSLREFALRFQTALAAADAAAGDTAEAEGANAARALLHASTSPFAVPRARLEEYFRPGARQELAAARAALDALKEQRPPEPARALAVQEGAVGDVPVHVRGSHLTLGPDAVPRGFLRVTDHALPPIAVAEDASGRLELARWLTDPEHPLTARVIVNRVWAGHFGEGLVRSPSNFGRRGDTPSHPELLDWLARDFVRQGWSLKALHRTICASATYRMASTRPRGGADGSDPAAELDPENRLLSRMNRRRLEAELVRDNLLHVAGVLDPTVGGTLLMTRNRGYVTNDQSADQARYDAPRRSLYLPVIRNAIYDLFATFDYNDPSVPVDRRPATVVAHQALVFLNSPLVRDAADALAQRVAEAGDDAARVALAFRIVYARPPSAREVDDALALLDDLRGLAARAPEPGLAAAPQESDGRSTSAGARRAGPAASAVDPERAAWRGLAQVLLSANEFLYVD